MSTRTAAINEVPEVDDVDLAPPSPDLPVGDSEAVFAGGPTNAQVQSWKDTYGEVFMTDLTEDEHIIWRSLSRFEYRRLMKNMEQAVASGQVGQAEANLNNEESVAETCILWPPMSRPDMAKMKAGVASLIAQEVMESSGFLALNVSQL